MFKLYSNLTKNWKFYNLLFKRYQGVPGLFEHTVLNNRTYLHLNYVPKLSSFDDFLKIRHFGNISNNKILQITFFYKLESWIEFKFHSIAETIQGVPYIFKTPNTSKRLNCF